MTRNQEIIENKLRETGRKGTSELLFKMNKSGYYSAKCSGYLFHSTLDSVAPSAYSYYGKQEIMPKILIPSLTGLSPTSNPISKNQLPTHSPPVHSLPRYISKILLSSVLMEESLQALVDIHAV